MKTDPYRFRSVEEWKSSLMILPDSSFYELLRSVFGNIKTPFNKQRLMEDLFVLLSREDIRNTIATYIDREDHKLIAATALLEDQAPDELENFFLGELKPAPILVNLEERLILYRFRDDPQGSKRRLALNPVLEPILAPFTVEKGILFPHTDAEDSESEEKISITDNRVLTALITFISGEEEFYKVDGIRKKVLDQGKRLFPDLDLVLTAAVLEQLGLFISQGEKFLPDMRKIREFGALSPVSRREYWAAGLYLHLSQGDSSGDFGFPRSRVRSLAFLIHRFCSLMESHTQYPDITFRRWLILLERNDSGNPWNQKVQFGPFIKALEIAGILSASSEEKSMRRIIPVNEVENQYPMIAMDSVFSFILYPSISFDHAMMLASFSSIKEDSLFHFELSRPSVVRGFDRGLNAGTMLELLKKLSENRIEENLEWTLKDWENRYTAVSLYEGLILSLSEDRCYLVETEPMASLVLKTLAPGIYLLSGKSSEAVEILQKAGVDIVARPTHEHVESIGINRTFPSIKIYHEKEESFSTGLLSDNLSPSSSESTKEHFRQYLRSLNLPKVEKDELLSRIERRLIFSKTQLEKAAIKFEKLEARLLDYAGKTSIAKQAIADGSMVEVSWPGPNGETRNCFSIPQALEKKEGESILVLKPLSGTEDTWDVLRIPLGKISLLRRIKQSIFEK